MRTRSVLIVGLMLLCLSGCVWLFPEPDVQPVVTYEEAFDNPASYAGTHAWARVDATASRVWIADGALQITVHDDDYFQSSYPEGVETGDVFRLDVGVCKVAGPEESEFGVIFYRDSNDDFLRFTITGDGMMRFRKRQGGTWTDIVPLTPCVAVNQGTDCNQIAVIANVSEFDFYVNEQLVLEASDTSFQRGGIGVIAANPKGSQDIHVGFPIVVLTELE